MSSQAAAGAVVAGLTRVLPADRLVSDPDLLRSLSADQGQWAAVGRPAAAVRAHSESEVLAAVRVAADLRAPIVPRGAGTGLSGGANAVDGCIVLDVSAMREVVRV